MVISMHRLVGDGRLEADPLRAARRC